MTERKRATIRTFLTVGYGEILIKVRKGVKGLRMAHLFSIQIIGEYEDGLRLVDICRLTGKAKGNISARLNRCMKAGFIRKAGPHRNLRWYLTDSGQHVYAAVVKESNAAINEITAILAEEVRRRSAD